MTATTIEQSKKLLEVGIDPNTADMSWFTTLADNKSKLSFHSHIKLKENLSKILDIINEPYEVIPAWSLEALLNLLPNPKLEMTDEDEWVCSYLRIYYEDTCKVIKTDSSDYYDNPIKACYELLLHYKKSH